MKKKLLIVTAKQISLWGSCKVISSNLHKSYKRLDSNLFDVQFVSIDKYVESLAITKEIELLVKKISEFTPDEIVFTDHLPHPRIIIESLLFFFKKNQLPVLAFHVYGDFTYFANEWIRLGDILRGCPIRLIVASSSQKKLVSYFTESVECISQYIFPIDESEYFYNDDERHYFRRENDVREHEKIILYSGRISLQKNVDILITNFLKISKHSVFPLKLWIVGSFDDLGADFQGVLTKEGYMFSKIQKILEDVPEQVKNSIRFWGHQDKENIRKINNAADMFISLSLYHDEDYGMSPAEALACGLPTLLTDWGGYSSFEETSSKSSSKWNIQLVDVELSEYGHDINTKQILSFFRDHSLSYINKNDRNRWSQAFLNNYSIDGALDILQSIYLIPANKFEGFNFRLNQFNSTYWNYNRGIEINLRLSPSSEGYYSKVYSRYISKYKVNQEDL